MAKELRYTDSPWDDEQEKLDKINLTGVKDEQLLARIRTTTGRSETSNFRSPKEKRKYLKMEKQYLEKKIPDGWITQMVNWALRKNKGRTIILFPALINAIMNKADMQDWINQQPKSESDTDTLMEKYGDEGAFD